MFRNAHYGESEDNQAVMPIRDLSDLLVTNYPGHSPVIRFDGVAGIQMNNVGFVLLVDFLLMVIVQVTRVEISGLRIIGPNNDITYEQAMADR